MSMFIKVMLHVGELGGTVFAEGISLNGVGYRTIIVQCSVTSMSFRRIYPLDELVKVAADHRLFVSNGSCFITRRHRSIICHAHHILSQCVKAMMHVLPIELWRVTSLIVGKGSSYKLLHPV